MSSHSFPTRRSSELATSLTVSEDGLLFEAEQQVRDYCGWHIAPSREEDLILDGPGGDTLLLPTMHLTDVTALTNGGDVIDVTNLQWSDAGIVRLWYWTTELRGIAISIAHGYPQVPPDLAGVVRNIALRAKESGGVGLKAKSSGPFSETYADEYPTEKAILDNYKIPSRP